MSQPQFIETLHCGGAPFRITEMCGGVPFREMDVIYGKGHGEYEPHGKMITGGRLSRHRVGSHHRRHRGGTLNPIHGLMTGGTLNPVHSLMTGGGRSHRRTVGSRKRFRQGRGMKSYIKF